VKKVLIFLVFFAIVIVLVLNRNRFKTPEDFKQFVDNGVRKQYMKILSPAFNSGDKFPQLYTCDGRGINPPLIFTELPPETQSLVLIVDDPDASIGLFTHWIVFNIDPSVSSINEDERIKIGVNGLGSSNQEGYVGACPSTGQHRYFFKLYALNSMLDLPQGADRKAVDSAMKDKIIDSAQLMAVYKRDIR
jgi:Raf kinase inhibitor-like YbhB/YbcL family protein